jgi:putative transposase
MKRSRFTEELIIGVLKEHQAGLSAAELCPKHGISDATFYTGARSMAAWRSERQSGPSNSRMRTVV